MKVLWHLCFPEHFQLTHLPHNILLMRLLFLSYQIQYRMWMQQKWVSHRTSNLHQKIYQMKWKRLLPVSCVRTPWWESVGTDRIVFICTERYATCVERPCCIQLMRSRGRNTWRYVTMLFFIYSYLYSIFHGKSSVRKKCFQLYEPTRTAAGQPELGRQFFVGQPAQFCPQNLHAYQAHFGKLISCADYKLV